MITKAIGTMVVGTGLAGGALLATLNTTSIEAKWEDIKEAIESHQQGQVVEHSGMVFNKEMEVRDTSLALAEQEYKVLDREVRIKQSTSERRAGRLTCHEKAFEEFGALVRTAGERDEVSAFGRRYGAEDGRKQLETFAEELLLERQEVKALDDEIEGRLAGLVKFREALAARRKSLAAKRAEGERLIAERRLSELRNETNELSSGKDRLDGLLEQMRVAQDEMRADEGIQLTSLRFAVEAGGDEKGGLSFSDVAVFEQRSERQTEVEALVESVLSSED